jgi:hypothetical protein
MGEGYVCLNDKGLFVNPNGVLCCTKIITDIRWIKSGLLFDKTDIDVYPSFDEYVNGQIIDVDKFMYVKSKY